jgi:hypothetical protein
LVGQAHSKQHLPCDRVVLSIVDQHFTYVLRPSKDKNFEPTLQFNFSGKKYEPNGLAVTPSRIFVDTHKDSNKVESAFSFISFSKQRQIESNH